MLFLKSCPWTAAVGGGGRQPAGRVPSHARAPRPHAPRPGCLAPSGGLPRQAPRRCEPDAGL